uniref:Uncharacterized protein n=1 Tax=Arion vulgaris TaxID=1028688 RepID=A0A0B7AWR1_9EUPU
MTTQGLTQVQLQGIQFTTRTFPNSPGNVVHRYFYLFPKLKENLKGQHFSCDGESEVKKVPKTNQ